MGDLIEHHDYTLDGIKSIDSQLPSRKQLRERRFDNGSGHANLPIYHSELDRNLINHFQKPGVRKVLRSAAFQSMLPGIDHELKMEQNPSLGLTEKFTRGMYVGKQGSNSSYAQPKCKSGVRKRVYKDSFYNTTADRRLQMPSLEKRRMEDHLNPLTPYRRTMELQDLPMKPASAQPDMSKVGNTAFGIRNHGGTHESPFFRRLQGGIAGKRQAASAPTCPDSARSTDFQMVKDSSHKAPVKVLTQDDYLATSHKYPPHMQHHHHYGWADAHIGTSLYRPNTEVVQANKNSIRRQGPEGHAMKYIDKVSSLFESVCLICLFVRYE